MNVTLFLTLLSNDFSWITEGGDGGVLAPLIESIKETGSALYQLSLTFGIAALFIGIAIAFILIMIGGRQGQQTGKINLLWILVAALGIFSIPAIVNLVANLGNSLNETVTDTAGMEPVYTESIEEVAEAEADGSIIMRDGDLVVTIS